MPEIPDLKEKLCQMLEAFNEKLRSIEMPDFDIPGLPTPSVPDIWGMICNLKPKRPSLPDMPDAEDEVVVRNPNSCAAGSGPPSEAQEKSAEVTKALENSDARDKKIGIPKPDFSMPDFLAKIIDKIKGMATLEIDLPAKFDLGGILKCLKKAAKKAGADDIEMPKMPGFSPLAALDAVKEAISGVAVTLADGLNLDEIFEGMKTAAGNLADITFGRIPSIDIAGAISKILSFFKTFELPDLDVDISQYMPALPSMPGMPSAPSMPGLPAGPALPSVGFKKGESPVEPENACTTHMPKLPKENEGAMLYACKEIGMVIVASARGYQGYYGSYCPSPYTRSKDVLASTTSGLYNKMGKGNMSKKPSSQPELDAEDEAALE